MRNSAVQKVSLPTWEKVAFANHMPHTISHTPLPWPFHSEKADPWWSSSNNQFGEGNGGGGGGLSPWNKPRSLSKLTFHGVPRSAISNAQHPASIQPKAQKGAAVLRKAAELPALPREREREKATLPTSEEALPHCKLRVVPTIRDPKREHTLTVRSQEGKFPSQKESLFARFRSP